jgi:hypothetical protein
MAGGCDVNEDSAEGLSSRKLSVPGETMAGEQRHDMSFPGQG